MAQTNIVQAEFFQSGTFSKVVFRFHDNHSDITRYTLKIKKTQKTLEYLDEKIWKASGLWREFFEIIHRLYSRRVSQMKNDIHLLTIDLLGEVVAHKADIAIHTWDRHFQFATQQEALALFAKAQESVGVWVFVFHSNDLLSDTNTFAVAVL